MIPPLDSNEYEEQQRVLAEQDDKEQQRARMEEADVTLAKIRTTYDDVVDVWRISVFTGGKEVRETEDMSELLLSGVPILVEFAKDVDIQIIKIWSTNIGMIRTYQKRFRRYKEMSP